MSEKNVNVGKIQVLDLNSTFAFWANDLSFLNCKSRITFLWLIRL